MTSRAESIRIKKEMQLKEFIAINFEGFLIESTYQKSSLKIKFKHLLCETVFERRPDRVYKNGLTCPKCYKEKPSHLRKSPEQYRQNFIEVYGDYLNLTSDYTHGENKINVECPEGHSWWSDPFYLLKGKGCPSCNKKNYVSPLKKSHQQFAQEMQDKFGDEYSILGEYELFNKPLFIRHNICGHEWNPIASNVYSSGSCPRCRQSKGEREIRKYLTNNSMTFEGEYVFEDCRGEKYSLRYDFCVLKDSRICFLIEYDGEFHFQENKMYKDEFKRKQKFKELKERDQIKTDYCKSNNLPLLRIPYWEYSNIKNILNEFINNLNNERSWVNANSN